MIRRVAEPIGAQRSIWISSLDCVCELWTVSAFALNVTHVIESANLLA